MEKRIKYYSRRKLILQKKPESSMKHILKRERPFPRKQSIPLEFLSVLPCLPILEPITRRAKEYERSLLAKVGKGFFDLVKRPRGGRNTRVNKQQNSEYTAFKHSLNSISEREKRIESSLSEITKKENSLKAKINSLLTPQRKRPAWAPSKHVRII